MASGNKIFCIKVNSDQEIEQVVMKLGNQQCLVMKFNNNNDIGVYFNNYATEMSAGFYLTQFTLIVEQSEKTGQILALMGAQVSIWFVYLFNLNTFVMKTRL